MEVHVTLSKCSVCDKENCRTGRHYGAVTCYPCRSFFRRSPERVRVPKCKYLSRCLVHHTVRVHCPGCRYQKCLSVGMKPEFVLNDEERKERFKKCIHRKNQKLDTSQDVSNNFHSPLPHSSSPITFPVPTVVLHNPVEDNIHGAAGDDALKDVYETTESNNEVVLIDGGSIPVQDDVNNEFPREPRNIIIFKQRKDLFERRDVDIAKMLATDIATDDSINISATDTTEEDTKSANIIETEQEMNDSLGDDKTDEESEDTKMILKYIHKKFSRKKNRLVTTESGIENRDFSGNSNRVSVIVPNYSVQQVDTTGDTLASFQGNHSVEKQSFDFFSMSTLSYPYFVQEEQFYLSRIQDMFEKSRSEISLGEKVTSEFIQFCTVREQFSLQFWKNVGHQTRERFLNFICSLEILEDVPNKTVYKLLKQNLAKAEMLNYICCFNAPSWVEELDYVFGETDMQHWRDRDTGIDGIPLDLMMQYMPLPEHLKLEMMTQLLSSCYLPILRDRNVLIFMIILTVLGEEEEQPVKSIRNNIISMFKRYLQQNSVNHVDFDFQNICRCIQTLPKLLSIFLSMKQSIINQSDQ